MDRFRTLYFRSPLSLRRFILVLLFVSLAGTARAETGKDPGRIQLRLTGSGVASAGVQDSGAGVSVIGQKGSVSYKDFFFSYERLDYSWENPEKLPFGNGKGDPWKALNVMGFGYARQGTINADWKYFAGGSLSSSFEDETQSSYGLGAFAGATYLFSSTLQFTMGAGLFYHEIQTMALPVIGINWNQGAPQGFSVAIGYPETHLSYRFNPEWAVRSRIVQFDRGIFRLSDNNTVEKEGYLKRQDLMADLGLEFTPLKHLIISARARYYFNRELSFYDRNGNHERKFDVDDAWGGVLSVSYRF